MKFLWISGWAIPAPWFCDQARAAWPTHEHEAVAPAHAADAVRAGGYDALGGYSLGALWLLKNAGILPESISVILLAPIFAFSSEAGCGGRIPLAQLRVQRRNFRRNAPMAVVDFYRRAGLDADASPQAPVSFTPAQMAELEMELAWLEKWQAPKQAPPANWHGFVGDADALLDASVLRAIWPKLKIISGASHAPGTLLRAAAAASILTGIA